MLNISDLGCCCLSRWMLFQKRIVRTKFDIYVLVNITGPIPLISLFSPWYSRKIAKLALSNNYTLTHSLDTSSGGLLVLDDIICRIVIVSALTMFFSLFTHNGLQHVITIWVTLQVSNKNSNMACYFRFENNRLP